MGHEQTPFWPFSVGNLGGTSNVQHRSPLAQALGGAAQGAGALNPGARTALEVALAQQAGLARLRTAYQAAVSAALGSGFAPEKPLEDSGIELGEIIAWRAWRLRKNGILRSTHLATRWLPGKIIEGDVRFFAGVHAFKDRRAAIRYGRLFNRGRYIVIGQVALWGEVIEHELGYRASYARIHSIDRVMPKFMDFSPWSWLWRRHILRRLRERYGVGAAV